MAGKQVSIEAERSHNCAGRTNPGYVLRQFLEEPKEILVLSRGTLGWKQASL